MKKENIDKCRTKNTVRKRKKEKGSYKDEKKFTVCAL